MTSKQAFYSVAITLFLLFSYNIPIFSGLDNRAHISIDHGIKAVEALEIGDKISTYNLETNTIERKPIKRIVQYKADTLYRIQVRENRFIEASPQQLFFTYQEIADESPDVALLQWTQAQDLTHDHMLVTYGLQCFPIIKIEKWSGNFDVHAIEIGAPHTLLVTDQTNSILCRCAKKGICFVGSGCDGQPMELFLAHNGVPALAIGAPVALAPGVTTITVTKGAACMANLGAAIGPAGVAIGTVVGVGWIAYEIYENHIKRKKAREPHKQRSSHKEKDKRNNDDGDGDGDNKNNKKKKKKKKKGKDDELENELRRKMSEKSSSEDTEETAKDFEQRISHMDASERVGEIKKKAEEVARKRGFEEAKKVSRKNNRFVYWDKKNKKFYSRDDQHGRFEVCNKKGKHLREVDFDFHQTKGPDKSVRHDLIVR